jgi:hypothetical protein
MTQHDRISDVIREFDSQGYHRTGTAADVESARWLAETSRSYATSVELEEVTLDRLVLGACRVEAGGRSVRGLPLFDGGSTGSNGVEGKLGPIGSDAEIGLLEVGAGEYQDDVDAERAAPRHAAYVVVTRGGSPGLACRNAPRFLSPFGPPVLQVSGEAAGWLDETARKGSRVRLLACAARSPALSYNVVATLPGRDHTLPPLVVMTPRSGWWQCAAERGGGIAGWLEVMRRLSGAAPARDVTFVATTGHELGLLGVHQFLAGREGLVRGAEAWIHFGASIGAAASPGVHLGAPDPSLESMARAALERRGAPDTPTAGEMVGAESNVVHAMGARCVAMAGGHAYFHMRSDRWPGAVDVDSVAAYANAFSDVAVEVAC